MKNRKGILAQIAIGRLPKASNPKVVLQVPIGVDLRQNVKLTIDKKASLEAAYLVCRSNSCLADLEFTSDRIRSMKVAKTLQLTFSIANGKKVTLPISLKGFADAYKAALDR